MPRTGDGSNQKAARPKRRRAWIEAVLLFGGCLLAGWLGGRAGRHFQFAAEDFRPAPPPHVYVSGPTYLEADAPLRPAGERGT